MNEEVGCFGRDCGVQFMAKAVLIRLMGRRVEKIEI
jgi:hypothetical protein